MKTTKLSLLFCLLLSFTNLFGQTLPEKKILNNDINPALIKSSSRIDVVQLSKNKSNENELIIVDDKIYKGGSSNALKLNKDSVVFIRSIIDEHSKSGIIKIFFYKTLKKP